MKQENQRCKANSSISYRIVFGWGQTWTVHPYIGLTLSVVTYLPGKKNSSPERMIFLYVISPYNGSSDRVPSVITLIICSVKWHLWHAVWQSECPNGHQAFLFNRIWDSYSFKLLWKSEPEMLLFCEIIWLNWRDWLCEGCAAGAHQAGEVLALRSSVRGWSYSTTEGIIACYAIWHEGIQGWERFLHTTNGLCC